MKTISTKKSNRKFDIFFFTQRRSLFNTTIQYQSLTIPSQRSDVCCFLTDSYDILKEALPFGAELSLFDWFYSYKNRTHIEGLEFPNLEEAEKVRARRIISRYLNRVDEKLTGRKLFDNLPSEFDVDDFLSSPLTSDSATSLTTANLKTVSSICSWKSSSTNSMTSHIALGDLLKALSKDGEPDSSSGSAELDDSHFEALKNVTHLELESLITGAAYLGFDPVAVRKAIMRKETDASKLMDELTILIITNLVRGPAVIFKKKSRIAKEYSNALDVLVKKYQIKEVVGTNALAITLPRICASFPDVCVNLLLKAGPKLTRSVPAHMMEDFTSFSDFPMLRGPYVLSLITRTGNPSEY